MAGILLHPTSLPGAGGLGREAFGFVDFLVNSGCQIWQMLPPGPVGPGNSPYAARSAFAGEPMLISLEKLADETRQRHERLKATVSSLQESLDYLRLSIKYLVFDLEATRRENGYLRKMLEETSGNSDQV